MSEPLNTILLLLFIVHEGYVFESDEALYIATSDTSLSLNFGFLDKSSIFVSYSYLLHCWSEGKVSIQADNKLKNKPFYKAMDQNSVTGNYKDLKLGIILSHSFVGALFFI